MFRVVLGVYLLCAASSAFRLSPCCNGWLIKHKRPLLAKPAIGHTVLAEVDDIGGSFKTPQVFLKVLFLLNFVACLFVCLYRDNCFVQISDGDEVYSASIDATSLNEFERKSLHVGSMIKVNVVSDDGNELVVALPGSLQATSSTPTVNRLVSHRQQSAEDHCSSRVARRKMENIVSDNQTVPPGLLLSNIKVGARLEGIVVHSTANYVLLDVGVFRISHGNQYISVFAILHRDDIPRHLVPVWDKDVQRFRPNLMEKGASAVVYVKEVYTNSG
jgi:hypothetical protein